jgi:hypothetical protein
LLLKDNPNLVLSKDKNGWTSLHIKKKAAQMLCVWGKPADFARRLGAVGCFFINYVPESGIYCLKGFNGIKNNTMEAGLWFVVQACS